MISRTLLGAAFITLSAVAAGCGWIDAATGPGGTADGGVGVGAGSAVGGGSGVGGSGTGGGGSGGNPTVGANTGVPCDVQQVLADHCWSCHGTTKHSGAPMSLVSYADLTALSSKGNTMAAQSVVRMKDAASPMPPGTGVTVPAAQLQTFSDWVAAGAPKGDCATDPDAGTGTDPLLDHAPVCTSGSTTPHVCGTIQNPVDCNGSSHMNPGEACVNCHTNVEGPGWRIGGTLYPTGHEPDDCNGASGQAGSPFAGVQVIVTDAANNVFTMTPNSVGNFYSKSFTPVTWPITAKVVNAQGHVRAMNTPQTSGDCNLCHTQNGDQNAPGRVTVPN